MNPNQNLFIELCLGESTANPRAHWIVSDKCRGCGLPVSRADFAIWNTYWNACWAASHKSCRDTGMKAEALACQCIDSDCNDCRHFKRGSQMVVTNAHQERFYSYSEEWMKKERPKFADFKLPSFGGHCLKFDKPTTAHPNFATGHDCFEHRRIVEDGK